MSKALRELADRSRDIAVRAYIVARVTMIAREIERETSEEIRQAIREIAGGQS
jgi:hypothetical protein